MRERISLVVENDAAHAAHPARRQHMHRHTSLAYGVKEKKPHRLLFLCCIHRRGGCVSIFTSSTRLTSAGTLTIPGSGLRVCDMHCRTALHLLTQVHDAGATVPVQRMLASLSSVITGSLTMCLHTTTAFHSSEPACLPHTTHTDG